ncbi:pepsin-like aspartic protease [Arenimonas aestuarii]
MPATIEIPTTLAHAKGAYTATASFGGLASQANLVLDTGSSSLAVLTRVYDPGQDAHVQATSLVQEINYGGGAWAGPVVRSTLGFGHGHHARRLPEVPFGVIESEAPVLRQADGIWGLAYRDLNPAYDVAALLASQGSQSSLSWPWPFPQGHALDLAGLRTRLQTQPRTHLEPAFTALEDEGIVSNRFAMVIGRAVVHVAESASSAAEAASAQLNEGRLVLGGGRELQHLYQGAFHPVRVLHDHYYNINLRAIRVGNEAPIIVPALPASEQATRYSNALLDTGSSFLVLDATVFEAVLAALGRRNPDFPALVARAQEALTRDEGVPNHLIDTRHWPDLHVTLEAPDGSDTELRVPASHYWPKNALKAGQSLCLLMSQLPHFRGQTILGLPLMAGRYVAFERDVGTEGRIAFADLRPTA